MELDAIATALQNPDYQYRLKAIAALKDYPAAIALPLFQAHYQDPEFLVRSFVARELSHFLLDESFALLLEIARHDDTPNVRAEAANSLSLFGLVSAAHLTNIFLQDDHWLVRRSILAALCDLAAAGEIWEVAREAIGNLDDLSTREAAIRALGALAQTGQETIAIELLSELHQADDWRVRQQVAYALKNFDRQAAKDLLTQLRQDSDHRVVAAALEDLLP
jgi:HEAT repeat protein